MLSDELFKTIVRYTPLISLDLIVRNSQGEVLLGKRMNRPAQGYWFVPGGRILKDEHIPDAFARLTSLELGVAKDIADAMFLGPYEHHYSDNFSGEGFTTHYIVLAFQFELDIPLKSLPNQQHTDYKWFSETELLNSANVHCHTQWYFQADKQLFRTPGI